MKLGYLLLLVLPVIVSSVPLQQQVPEDNEVDGRSSTEDGNWKIVAKILDDCAEKDMTSCLGVKAVTALERAARMRNIDLMDGVSLVKTSEAEASGRALVTENDVQNSLDQEPSQKTARLIDMIFEAAARFLKTHSIQFRLPQAVPEQIQRALDEGRGKKKILKTLLPLILGIGAKLLLLIPAGIGLIGLIAVKAFFVSKLALLIAGAIAIQKLLGGGGLGGFGKNSLGSGGSGGWSSGGSAGYSGAGYGTGGWSTGSGSSGGWSRSLDDADAHQMAFKAQIPQQQSTVSAA
ncbi:uncharacterized protein [Anabrus simplex]|uniref:uncharacterized protein n=1 Tax=Anabrus simplex TaxID=316456 RepID=UPI0034DD0AD1